MTPGDTFRVNGQWYLVEEVDHFKRSGIIAVEVRKVSEEERRLLVIQQNVAVAKKWESR